MKISYILIILFFYNFVYADSCQVFNSIFPIKSGDFKSQSYNINYLKCVVDNAPTFVIRQFELDQKKFYLIVDPNTLQTKVVSQSCLKSCQNWRLGDDQSTYSKYLNVNNQKTNNLMNTGLQSLPVKGVQFFLTMDLCPSRKALDYDVFNAIESDKGSTPVAIAISGGWLKHHTEEFYSIVRKIHQKKIDVTWINHSLNHPYAKEKPIHKNFLLSDGIDFKNEVIGHEILMISQGLVPSVFFRFPGLVSNDDLVSQLNRWGLISIGSNAWLAKGEKIKSGSIILVHANGNEPLGIRKLIESILDYKITQKNWAPLLIQ